MARVGGQRIAGRGLPGLGGSMKISLTEEGVCVCVCVYNI